MDVSAGLYSEDIVITVESISIIGPNAGLSGYDDDRGDEAVIEAANDRAITVDADNVTIDGFSVTDSDTDRIIFVNSGAHNVKITSSVIVGEGFGAVWTEGTDFIFESNVVENTGDASGLQGEPAGNLTVQDNVFRDSLAFNDASSQLGDVLISGNRYVANEAGIGIGSGWTSEGVDSLVIMNNTFESGGDFAIKLWDFSNDSFNHVDITDNVWVATGGNKGIDNMGEDLLDATDNWWGSESGPYHPDKNPDGEGAEVSDNVLFDPWTSAELSVSPSIVEFDEVEVGDSETATVFAENVSPEFTQLEVGIIGALGDGFEVVGGDCSPGMPLPGGESCSIEVGYVPDEEGSDSGVLTVASDANNDTASLIAEAVEPDLDGSLSVEAGELPFPGQEFFRGDLIDLVIAASDITVPSETEVAVVFDGQRPSDNESQPGEHVCEELLGTVDCDALADAIGFGNTFTADATLFDDTVSVREDAELGSWTLRFFLVEDDNGESGEVVDTVSATVEVTDELIFQDRFEAPGN